MKIKGDRDMQYQEAKELLERKGQTQLLKYYEELDENGKATVFVNYL